MSLDYFFARCSDGKWYKDPVWFDVYKGRDWYICFDDDDPPEIVIAGAVGPDETKQLATEILDAFGCKYHLVRRGSITTANGQCQRCFPQDGSSFEKMKNASSWFFQWDEAPPAPRRPTLCTQESNVSGVLYPYGGALPKPKEK